MNSDYSRYFASMHPDTPEHWRQMDERMRRWLEPHLPRERSARVVDVGCGHGYALQTLRGLNYSNVEGIDTDAGQAAYAKTHGLPAEHVSDPAAWLSARPLHYDVVLLMDVLEHVTRADHPGFLQAIANSLKPGGKLILTVPNAAASLAGHWRYIDYTHHFSFTPGGLDFLLTRTGFTRTQCHEIELLPPSWTPRGCTQRFFRLWRRLEFVAEFGRVGGWPMPVTPNLLAVAEKP